jgi:hypothetical protein
MRFELRTVWPAIDQGGLVLVDDVDNQAFRDFVQESGEPPSTVMRSGDGPWKFGAVRKDNRTRHSGRLSDNVPTSLSANREMAHRTGISNGHGI